MEIENIIYILIGIIMVLIGKIIELKSIEKRLRLQLKKEKYIKAHLYKMLQLQRKIRINLN